MKSAPKRVRAVTSFNIDADTEANLKSCLSFYSDLRLRMSSGAVIRRAIANLAAHARDLRGAGPDRLIVEKAIASGYTRVREA